MQNLCEYTDGNYHNRFYYYKILFIHIKSTEFQAFVVGYYATGIKSIIHYVGLSMHIM